MNSSNPKPFRPLLAAETPGDLQLLQPHFPLYGSYKLDGIRAIVRNGVLVSRTLKPIPSAFCQKNFARKEFEGFDGELLVPKQYGPTIYHDTYSAVMTHGSMEPVDFWVFDQTCEGAYINRQFTLLTKLLAIEDFASSFAHTKVLTQRRLLRVEDVSEMEAEALNGGYEGLIVRRLDSPYKFGRSTFKEGHLIKIKRTQDAEAVVVGFEELMHNNNEATTSELGFTKRSSHQENKVASGMLGALLVKQMVREEGALKAIEFKIGSGFDHSLRKEIWAKKEQFFGRIVKYKFLPYGTKELPRHPVFLGWRDPSDV